MVFNGATLNDEVGAFSARVYRQTFKVSDKDESGDPKYYGYLDKEGHWYILEEGVAADTFRYAYGASDYATNWTGKAGLSYGLYNEVF